MTNEPRDIRLNFLTTSQQFQLEAFNRNIHNASKEELLQLLDQMMIHVLLQDSVTKKCYKKELGI